VLTTCYMQGLRLMLQLAPPCSSMCSRTSARQLPLCARALLTVCATRAPYAALRRGSLRWCPERNLHGQLSALHESIPAAVRNGLCFHFILTVLRDTGALGTHNPVHADTVDGTMLSFALMCTKVPTPIYPAAAFEPSALERLAQEAAGNPQCRDPTQPATPASTGNVKTFTTFCSECRRWHSWGLGRWGGTALRTW
jgi:hypothetical protein